MQWKRRVTVYPKGCGLDSYSRKRNILHFHFCNLITRHSAALSSVTQHTMPLKFSKNWLGAVTILLDRGNGNFSIIIFPGIRLKSQQTSVYLNTLK